MKGTCLKFYVAEKHRLHGALAYEWLLKKAQDIGLPGGSAFRAIAGFGRHGAMRDDHFLELQGDLPVEVSFAVSDADADRLLDALRAEGVSLFYMRIAIESGATA